MRLGRKKDKEQYTGPPVDARPSGGSCKRCGQERLVFYDNGTGKCMNCHRDFRWDGLDSTPAVGTGQYGGYDIYKPEPAGPHGYSPPYPADQGYGGEGVKPPASGQCKDCGSSSLTFHPNGRGECHGCGRLFDWLSRGPAQADQQEIISSKGLYVSKQDIYYALDTGTKPEFIFNELIHQGKLPREANKIINGVLDDLAQKKESQRVYLKTMIRNFENNDAGFQRTGSEGNNPRNDDRPVGVDRRVGSEADFEDNTDDDDYDDDYDEEEEEEAAELEEDEDFEFEFDETMVPEPDVKLSDGPSVTLPDNLKRSRKDSDESDDIDWM